MKLKSVLVASALLIATAAWAQDLVPKSEITAGYTYGSMDQNVGFGSTGRLNSNGWNGGATAFLNKWFGVEGNVAGLSHTDSSSIVSGGTTISGSVSEKHYTYVFGPRISLGEGRLSPFVHGLFGVDHETLSSSASLAGTTVSTSASDNAFATALGGGVEFGASKHLALTTGADYLMTRHGVPSQIASVLGTSGSATQNNFRVSVGVAFRFGGFGSGSHR